MSLSLQPISYAEAAEFVRLWHRHQLPPQQGTGWKFGVAVNDGAKVVGVVTLARPVNQKSDDGWTLEVTRCCTDGTKNACSMLYGAAWRAAKALGYRRIITYTFKSEPGTSLVASGWRLVHETNGYSSHAQSRKGDDAFRPSRLHVATHAPEQKILWEAV